MIIVINTKKYIYATNEHNNFLSSLNVEIIPITISMYDVYALVNWLSDGVTEVPISITFTREFVAVLISNTFLPCAAQFLHEQMQLDPINFHSCIYTLYLIMHSGNRFHSLYQPWNAIRHANLSYRSQSTISGSLKRQHFSTFSPVFIFLLLTCTDITIIYT